MSDPIEYLSNPSDNRPNVTDRKVRAFLQSDYFNRSSVIGAETAMQEWLAQEYGAWARQHRKDVEDNVEIFWSYLTDQLRQGVERLAGLKIDAKTDTFVQALQSNPTQRHLVMFGPPKQRMIGKAKNILSDDTVRTSTDGRFTIESRSYSSGRNGYYTGRGYVLTDLTTGKSVSYDSLAEARMWADYAVDPDWGNGR